jgi:hypothetical protein
MLTARKKRRGLAKVRRAAELQPRVRIPRIILPIVKTRNSPCKEIFAFNTAQVIHRGADSPLPFLDKRREGRLPLVFI